MLMADTSVRYITQSMCRAKLMVRLTWLTRIYLTVFQAGKSPTIFPISFLLRTRMESKAMC